MGDGEIKWLKIALTFFFCPKYSAYVEAENKIQSQNTCRVSIVVTLF
jgi:hypothetical protein